MADPNESTIPPGWDRTLTSPSGATFRLRAVRKGDPIRPESSEADDLTSMAFELAVDGVRSAVRWARREHGQLDGFVVGVIKEGRVRSKIVHRAEVAAADEVVATLDSLEQKVLAGSFD